MDKFELNNRLATEAAFSSGDEVKICNALVEASFYDPDWRWVQDRCLHFLQHENYNISGLAATCLGHIARIHKQLEKEKVIAALQEKLIDSEISSRVGDALDDIDMFV